MCVKKSVFFVKKIIIWFIVVYYKRNNYFCGLVCWQRQCSVCSCKVLKNKMNSDLTIYQPSDESIVVYKSNDGVVQLEVQLANETVWLTLTQLAMLFDKDKSVISCHLRNIYAEGELTREVTVAKKATVQIYKGIVS